jgi:hypothetical protein
MAEPRFSGSPGAAAEILQGAACAAPCFGQSSPRAPSRSARSGDRGARCGAPQSRLRRTPARRLAGTHGRSARAIARTRKIGRDERRESNPHRASGGHRGRVSGWFAKAAPELQQWPARSASRLTGSPSSRGTSCSSCRCRRGTACSGRPSGRRLCHRLDLRPVPMTCSTGASRSSGALSVAMSSSVVACHAPMRCT